MLLRRLTKHISRQNWFAVVLELFIVALGVFLGFQVTTWNEQRSDRALEAEYLKRIHGELLDAKVELDAIILDANGNKLYAPELSAFLNGDAAKPDPQRLVVAIYKFTLDPIDRGFDMSTFNDLVSTGRLRLISNPEVRRGIQHAYGEMQNFAPFRNPYRDEFKFALGGLISTPVSRQIRAACPENAAYSSCSGLDLDGDTIRSIVDQIDRREAQLAFNNRDRGLGAVIGKGGEIQNILDETIELLEQQSAR